MSTSSVAYLRTPVVQALDWVGFISLGGTAAVLAYRLMNFKPPNKDILYFFGYREKGMISLYVNLFAAVAYYARITSHLSGDVGAATNIILYKYFDYLITCPLLVGTKSKRGETFDLLTTLNLPYKITYAVYVQITIFTGFMSANTPPPATFLWFAFGMLLFSYTWFNIISLVQVRFIQYFAKKGNTTQSRRVSVASKAGFRNKNVRNPLQTALSTYFCIWMVYPVLWLLLKTKVIDQVTEHCINVVMDVLAKSMYGFALLRFQLLMDKANLELSELKVTKSDLMEDFNAEKKKMRELRRRQQAEMEAQEMSDDDEDVDDQAGESNQSQKSKAGKQSSGKNSPISQEQLGMLLSQMATMQQMSSPRQMSQPSQMMMSPMQTSMMPGGMPNSFMSAPPPRMIDENAGNAPANWMSAQPVQQSAAGGVGGAQPNNWRQAFDDLDQGRGMSRDV
ncbi:hypothetical protein GUITHDRAFT_148915 [Guillardia theta CCMP2712]|uniref:Uncharacterized protein n=1 Tax=Guillardia theta (strain CCMP2712) TaxID=905079 RepID=L1I7F9_GUITC|nr:hypothetical protein GUITHDRAFT_148915 [Guillardia theta CCMP2712]EKX32022.1 hypothetical protein GUITHDRAFT_148915 [Guillardia theta CCMP2712]|eukprot:XP_005819002.1 hypothetical protein GUITHDRAFT_148915 [Guillardia theta CCMP2712]